MRYRSRHVEVLVTLVTFSALRHLLFILAAICGVLLLLAFAASLFNVVMTFGVEVMIGIHLPARKDASDCVAALQDAVNPVNHTLEINTARHAGDCLKPRLCIFIERLEQRDARIIDILKQVLGVALRECLVVQTHLYVVIAGSEFGNSKVHEVAAGRKVRVVSGEEPVFPDVRSAQCNPGLDPVARTEP